MSAIRGYPSQQKLERTPIQFATVEPVHKEQNGISVVAHQYVVFVAIGVAEAGSTNGKIVTTSHEVLEGDVLHVVSGVNVGKEVKVVSVTANEIFLAEDLPLPFAALDEYEILRHKYPRVNNAGEVNVTGTFAFNEQAVAEPGQPIPTEVKVVGGSDGTLTRALSVDGDGELQVDIVTSVLPNGAATSDNQTDGSQKTQIVDGSGNVIGSTANALDVNLKSPLTVEVDLSQADDSVLVYGNDGAVNRALKTDATGRLQVDVISVPAAAGSATYAAQTDGSQKTQIVDGTGEVVEVKALNVALVSTDKGLVTNTIIHGLTTGGGGGYVDVKVTPSGALTVENTLSGIDASVLGQEAMASSLPVVLASDQTAIPVTDNGSSLTIDGSVSVSSSALPTGAATEATLLSVDGKLPATIGQKAMTASLAVAIASDQTAIPVTGTFSASYLSVVDLLDANILDTSSTNIPGSASAPVEVVASLAAAVKSLQLLDTTGAFIGLYVGGSGSEVLKLIIGPGSDQTIEHAIASGERISLKRLDSATAISSGIVAINFLG